MAKHEFVPVRESDASVDSGQCIQYSIIVPYVNGVLPEKVLDQDCQRWDFPSNEPN
jgi:hypothetical protein